MTRAERQQVEKVLGRISREAFDGFLESREGRTIRDRLHTVRDALRAAGRIGRGAPRRPLGEIVDLLGQRLLSEDRVGTWVRQELMSCLAPSKFEGLRELYRDCDGARADRIHGNMSQDTAAATMAPYWHQGSAWAIGFCDAVGLPEVLARRQGEGLPSDEEVAAPIRLPPLHDFQVDCNRKLRKFLHAGRGKAVMLSLPTGAGKTRVAVEAVCGHLLAENDQRRRGPVLWISQSDELQRQAWECFRHVWQSITLSEANSRAKALPLRIVRMWGGRDLATLAIGPEPTVLVAGIDQLNSWVSASGARGERGRLAREVLQRIDARRLSAIVLDEAHRCVNDEHRSVLVALCARAQRRWKTVKGAAPVIGLTATPWRTQEREFRELLTYFNSKLLRPRSLGYTPVATLQRRGILSRVRPTAVNVRSTRPMSSAQLARFEQFRDLPADYVAALGDDRARNVAVLKKLRGLPKRAKVLVFACSIKHAEVLALLLEKELGDGVARVVTSDTPRAERLLTVQEFRRKGALRFLVNVGVLATGFDAPSVDVVCLTRPTASALRYEQMLGRGLRGPKNGGTRICTVIDVQDEGLPEGIQSYGRVLSDWDTEAGVRA